MFIVPMRSDGQLNILARKRGICYIRNGRHRKRTCFELLWESAERHRGSGQRIRLGALYTRSGRHSTSRKIGTTAEQLPPDVPQNHTPALRFSRYKHLCSEKTAADVILIICLTGGGTSSSFVNSTRT
eukprot:scaffold82658_cov42-Prasinocladus_malaysianus.AAC.1